MEVIYVFVGDMLVRTKYMSTQTHSNKTLFIQDYNNLQKLLTTKYGKPDQEETIWLNTLFQDDYSDWGVAVAAGHLAMGTVWNTSSTLITLLLNGDNYEIRLGVEYVSKTYKHLEKQEKQNQSMEDL